MSNIYHCHPKKKTWTFLLRTKKKSTSLKTRFWLWFNSLYEYIPVPKQKTRFLFIHSIVVGRMTVVVVYQTTQYQIYASPKNRKCPNSLTAQVGFILHVRETSPKHTPGMAIHVSSTCTYRHMHTNGRTSFKFHLRLYIVLLSIHSILHGSFHTKPLARARTNIRWRWWWWWCYCCVERIK